MDTYRTSSWYSTLTFIFHYILAFQANEKMQARLAAMEKEMMDEKKKRDTNAPQSSASSPALKAKDPKPKKKSVAKPALATEASEDSGSDGEGEPSHAAKLGRLRRLCERKPSGKLKVPKEIHDRWVAKGHLRDELLRELEKADWGEDWVSNFPVMLCCKHS